MARKRPPGARRPGPTGRRRIDPFSDHPDAVVHRMLHAEPVVVCLSEDTWQVSEEARRWLDARRDDLPHGTYSVMFQADSPPWELLSVFGVPPRILGELYVHLMSHPRADEWGLAEPLP